MNASKKSINDIFNGQRLIHIPFFQRAYVWDTPQWERLVDDMESISNSSKPYFLGSVILKQIPTNTSDEVGDKRMVIDGQQRLTTLNIFFKVLCLKNGQNQFFDKMFRLMLNNKIALSHNHNDIESFEKIMNLESLLDLPENKGDNIIEAYRYFYQHIEVDKLNFNKILVNVVFVGIDLDNDEDEQEIFDTINSLGVKLTTAELLKNYFFSTKDDIEKYKIYWQSLFEKDDDTKNYWDIEILTGRYRRTFIDLFFYSYLQIKVQEKDLNVSSEDKLRYSKVEHLFDSYKDFIKNYLGSDKNIVLKEIKQYAETFMNNFDLEIIKSDLSENYGMDRINAIIFGLENSTLIPYVLYLLQNIKEVAKLNELFQCLESYIMRRMVVRANNKNYNQLFTDRLISNSILSKQEFIDFISQRDDKVNYMPSNEEVVKGFNESYLVNSQARGILYLIESKVRNRQLQSTNLKGISEYSLEHIMPKKWENHWGKLSDKEAKQNRDRKLLTLGNLTIIPQALNSAVRDSKWETKKKGAKGHEGLIKYSSGIETFQKYLHFDIWNENGIQERANELSGLALKVWDIN
ncbi:MAG: DUF262 domain-containing protein [Chitinophagales bacterium]|jgi:hypothetical protein